MNSKFNSARSYHRPRRFDRSDFRSLSGVRQRLEDARGGFRANGDGFRDSFRGNIAGFRDDLNKRDVSRSDDRSLSDDRQDKSKQHVRESSRDYPDKDNFSENFHERQVDYRKDVRTKQPESKYDSQREAF